MKKPESEEWSNSLNPIIFFASDGYCDFTGSDKSETKWAMSDESTNDQKKLKAHWFHANFSQFYWIDFQYIAKLEERAWIVSNNLN